MGAVKAAVAALLFASGLASAPRSSMAWDLILCAAPNNLPFSDRDGTGFENRIAAALADYLGAKLDVLWFHGGEETIDTRLRVGECDVVMDVEDGHPAVLSTLTYYRSPYVFVQRADRSFTVHSFDDLMSQNLSIGVQATGGPAHDALSVRGLEGSIHRFYDTEPEAIINDVARGEIDVGVMWGPTAGYLASTAPVPLKVSPVTPEFEPPFIPMFINMVMGVRRGDEELRDLLDGAIAARWDEITAILEDLHVPIMPLQKPVATR